MPIGGDGGGVSVEIATFYNDTEMHAEGISDYQRSENTRTTFIRQLNKCFQNITWPKWCISSILRLVVCVMEFGCGLSCVLDCVFSCLMSVHSSIHSCCNHLALMRLNYYQNCTIHASTRIPFCSSFNQTHRLINEQLLHSFLSPHARLSHTSTPHSQFCVANMFTLRWTHPGRNIWICLCVY